MKRVVSILAVALLLSGCATRERPEGIVERWLSALNQGSAGEPQHYAPDRLSEQVLPGWRHLDPGEFDVIAVQPATIGTRPAADPDQTSAERTRIASVPFTLEDIHGGEFGFEAELVDRGGWRVTRVDTVDHPMAIPETGWPSTLEPASWLVAVAVGVALLVFGEGVMRLVRRGASR